MMLELRNVSKTFFPGTADEKQAIKDLSLKVDKGEFITIIGSNGAGKSTMFQLIAGSLLADTGRVFLDGEDVTFVPEHVRSRSIGRLFQDPLSGTAPGLTIEENLALVYLHIKKGSSAFSRVGKEERELLRERLSLLQMGLEDRMKQPVGLLSGGQRQALTLLLATLDIPKLLLLDEHTAALDPASAEKVMQLTNEIVKENGITCLMITHNLYQALEAGTRTLIMSNGQICADLSGEERRNMSVEDLQKLFRETAGKNYAVDRMLLN